MSTEEGQTSQNNIDSKDICNVPSQPLLLLEAPLHYFDDSISINGEAITILSKSYSPEEYKGTGVNTWDGAFDLSKYLIKNPSLVNNMTILELGSGTGLAGITCGKLNARKVYLSDLPYTEAAITENINVNNIKNTCEWFHLDWSNNTTYPSDDIIRNIDVIVLTDCVWLMNLVDLLVNTLSTIIGKNKQIVFYMAHQERSKEVDKHLFKLLNKEFKISLLKEKLGGSKGKIDIYKGISIESSDHMFNLEN